VDGAAPADRAPSDTANMPDTTSVLSELTQAVRKYAAEQKKVPASLDELVANNYLPSIPEAPAGKKFAIDKKLQVYLADK
jgi:hypothetical protein